MRRALKIVGLLMAVLVAICCGYLFVQVFTTGGTCPTAGSESPFCQHQTGQD